MDLPVAFEEKMRTLLGDEFDRYIQCFEENRLYGMRVNTNKISVEEFRRISPWNLTPIPWIENGFYYDGEKEQPAKHPYYAAGLFYLQEPSAMTPANRLLVEPGERVLDLCAAPGGKATELGAKLKGEGVLIANDLSSSRAKGLLKNLELFGIGNLLVLSEEPGKLTEYFPEYFDKILIDAPCSGEGMFRKDRKMVRAWERHGPEYFSGIQKNIILQAARMLRKGGMMLYSTCTFDCMENEQVILHLLHHFPEFEICEITPYEGFRQGFSQAVCGGDCDGVSGGSVSTDRDGGEEALQKTVRIFPYCMQGEGHYLALLRRTGSSGTKSLKSAVDSHVSSAENHGAKYSAKVASVPEVLAEFFADVSWELRPERLDIRKDYVYYMPEEVPALKGIRFLRTGLLLGELKKNRFEPSQALAMYLRKNEYRRTLDLRLSDTRVMKYLKGETLEVEDLIAETEKGWYLVCVDGYPLGWGKLVNGRIKNKYLPGWRW